MTASQPAQAENQIPAEKLIVKITVVSGLLYATGLLNFQRRASLERADAREVQEHRQILDPARINASRAPDVSGIIEQVSSHAAEGDIVRLSYELPNPSFTELKAATIRIDELRQYWQGEVEKLEAHAVFVDQSIHYHYRPQLLNQLEAGRTDRAGNRASVALDQKIANAKADLESIRMRITAARSWVQSASEVELQLQRQLGEMHRANLKVLGRSVVIHETYPVDGGLRARLVNLLEFRVRVHGLNGIDANPTWFQPVARAENIRIPSPSNQRYALRIARGAAGGMVLSLALVAYELKTSAVSDALTKTAETGSRVGPVLKERLPY